MKLFIITIFLMLAGTVFAQYTLEAVVLDGLTRQPVVNANVYLDGTTKGTTTDLQGRFRLTVNNIINTSLVISYIGYERVIIQNPFRTLPKTIFLEEDVNLIDEVIVTAKIDKSKRREMLALFKKYFFGERVNSCRILNEDDIMLSYNAEQELIGTARKPLKIINNQLKYFIRFDLIEFKIIFTKSEPQKAENVISSPESFFKRMDNANSQKNDNVQHFSIIGTAQFEDIGNNNKILIKRREIDYYQSFRYFFKLLANNKIKVNADEEPNFDVHFQIIKDIKDNKNFKSITFYDQDSLFLISESQDYPSTKTFIIKTEMRDSITGDNEIKVGNFKRLSKLQTISFNERGREYAYRSSEIVFYTDTFNIDANGNTDLYDNFMMKGYFGQQRIGNLLPFDYTPEQAEKTSLYTIDTVPEPVEERIRYYLERQVLTYPQENIYVHTDKTCYVAGETLRFRAYLTDYNTNAPYVESRYVYGEMYDPGDSLVMRVKIRQDSIGTFKGYLDLHPNLTEGYYRLRFFTRYMEEAGEEYFFNKTIFIGNAYSKIHPVEEAYRSANTSASASISLVIASLRSNPESASSSVPYSASSDSAASTSATIATTSSALSASVNLKAVQTKDSLIVEALVSGNDPQPDSLRLLVQCRGNLYRIEPLSAGEMLSFDKEDLPSGVIQLLLLDGNLKPLSERLIFNLNDKDLARININSSKESYRRREQVELSVELTTYDGLPIQDGFSISVTSEVQPSENINALRCGMPHLYSQILLTSELKGYVENPALDFADEKHMEEIDHLLLTQGWSRYNMADLLEGYITKPKSLPEESPEITGTVSYGMLRSPKSGQFVRMNTAGIDHKFLPESITEVTDKNFDLTFNEYPNGTTFTLQLGLNPSRTEINPAPEVYPKNTLKPPYAYNMGKPEVEAFLKNNAQTFEPYSEEWQRFEHEVLKTGDYATGVSPLSPGRRQDRVISTAELWKNKKLTLRQFLTSVENLTIRSDENGAPHLRYRNGANYYDYVVIVDDRWFNADANSRYDANFTSNGEYSLDDLLSLPVDRFKEVEIVQAPAPPIAMKNFGNLVVNDPALHGINESLSPVSLLSPRQPMGLSHPGYMGTILITTIAQNAGISNALKIAPLGYQVNRDFYSPVYETIEQREDPTPDLRTTIYWNPEVQTDDEGKAKISFYASDVPTTYTITIEGITSAGLLIRKSGKIVIK